MGLDHNNDQVMPFTIYQFMLCERLRHFINTLHPLLKSDVAYALEQRGKLLCPLSDTQIPSRPNGMWALLPLLIVRDIQPGSDIVLACNVGIAVECLICALDLLDDVEDGDQTPTLLHLGIARTLNVSTTLLLLAQQALLSLQEWGTPQECITALIVLLQERTLAAATGQHEDLVSEEQAIECCTQEDCIRIARGKAGSLLRLA